MITYTYVVRCPECEDEFFDFFDEAKAFAMSCMSKKPVITQTEVNRNDFGECTDHCDLGTIWSWEDMMSKKTDAEPATFSKDDIKADYDPDNDPEFQDNDITFEEPTLTEEFDRVKAAAQCMRNCYDFYEAIASEKPQKEINKHGKKAYKFVKDQFGLVDDKAEDLLWSGYVLWRNLRWRGKTESLTEATEIPSDDYYVITTTEGGRRYYIRNDIDFKNPPEDAYEWFTHDLDKAQLFSSRQMAGGYFVERDLGGNVFAVDDKGRKVRYYDYVKTPYECWLIDTGVMKESCRKPIPEGMTIEQLVEEMEENEDTVECVLCQDLFDKSTCRKELNLGWLCRRCADDLVARGEGPVFKEDNYWDFLDEEVDMKKRTWVCYYNGNDLGTVEANTEEEAYLKMEQTWPEYNYNNEDVQVIPEDELDEELDLEAVHDLGNEYDGGYPAETPEVSDSYLKLCPECGNNTFDTETGICVDCGFN